MAAGAIKSSSSASSSYLLVPITLFFALLIVAVLRSESLVSNAGIGSAIIVAAPLILATYALMALVIAGRGTIDLSIGPLLGFINVTLIQLFGADVISSGIAFFIYALGVGVLYQLLMGLIIVFIRVQPIIVSLAGYLALSGINLVIMERPGGVAPEWMMPWGLGTSIFSPVALILLLATAAWLWFTRSSFYGHLRLMGADERAAFTSGVRINLVRLGAHVIAGLFAGLAALTYTSLISSGDPTQGTTYTLIAVTALVLGGANLAGGRGGVTGSLLGAVNIYLITYVLATFNFGAVQSFVTDLAYGAILVLSLLLTLVLPHIRRVVGGISPLLFFVILSMIAVGVIIHATYDYSAPKQVAAVSASSGITVLGGSEEPAAESSGIQVLGGSEEPAAESSGITVLGGSEEPAESSGITVLGGEEPAKPAAAAPKRRTYDPRGTVFIFEQAEPRAATPGEPSIARPLAFAALLLLSFLVILRMMVAQAGSRTLAPLLYVVVAAFVVLGVYVVAFPEAVTGPSAATAGADSQ